MGASPEDAPQEQGTEVLLGLKIDLFSFEAVHDTLPALLPLLRDYQVQGTFFPALGPDAMRRRGGLAGRLPGPWSAPRRLREALWSIRDGGHELGLLPYDVGLWRRQILGRDAAWTRAQMVRGAQAFEALFGQRPHVFAAPGLLLNADTPRLESELGLDYAVDSRGLAPFYPVTVAGAFKCPQIPVTLPPIEEALAAGEPLEQVHQLLFMESQKPLLPGHVFSFTAETGYVPVLERLLVMWLGSQRRLVPVRRLFDEVKNGSLPYHRLGLRRVPDGGPGFTVQGDRVEACG
jgi:hypothetical protein